MPAVARKTGFTLVELLVVIAIIAVLAAILFPVFATIRAKARQAACATNIKQIVSAALSYADDWGNRLPGLNAFGDLQDGCFAFSSKTPKPSAGRGSLWPYLKTRAIFVCPEDLQHRMPRESNTYGTLGGFNYTYTVNSYMTLASLDRKLADIAGPPLSKSRMPSQTIILVDENTDPNKGESTVNDAHFAVGDRTCDRHPGPRVMQKGNYASWCPVQGVANVGYLDGHTGIVPGLLRWDSDMGRELFLK